MIYSIQIQFLRSVKQFQEMLRKVTSSSYYSPMMRFVVPLKEHFGVNHFWYYRVTHSGQYTYLGTNENWNEYCFENHLLKHFPCLRHPDTLVDGISLMNKSTNQPYACVLKTAWEKFQINFNINIQKKIPDGIEAFGFATQYNHSSYDEKLLNELPLLCHFTQLFREKHFKLFEILDDNPIDLSAYLGPLFSETEDIPKIPRDRELFLKKIGSIPYTRFTKREKDVLKYVSNGFPASYIAEQLQLQKRTVENYLDTVKSKLSCSSKVELIQKAQKLVSIGYLNLSH